MASLKVVSCLVVAWLIVALLCGFAAYGLWANDVSAKYAALTYDFGVNGSELVDYGLVVDSASKVVSYTVMNFGNVEVEVSPVLVSVAGAVASWDRNVSVVPVGGNETFVLSLAVNGSGGVEVSFTGLYCDYVWHGAVSWRYEVTRETFDVDGELAIAFGNVTEPAVESFSYVVSNTGNVPISVVAGAEVTGNLTSVSWDKNNAAIPVGESKTFTLTLVVNGTGTCAVAFTKQP